MERAVLIEAVKILYKCFVNKNRYSFLVDKNVSIMLERMIEGCLKDLRNE